MAALSRAHAAPGSLTGGCCPSVSVEWAFFVVAVIVGIGKETVRQITALRMNTILVLSWNEIQPLESLSERASSAAVALYAKATSS